MTTMPEIGRPGQTDQTDQSEQSEQSDQTAIIAMACRVPGADNPRALWRNLLAGRDEHTPVTARQAVLAGADPTRVSRPEYVLGVHGVDGVYRGFDAALFGLSSREADLMDPQHRLFAEVVWEALESAGVTPADGPVGVFGSVGMNQYAQLVVHRLGLETSADDPTLWLLNDPDFLSTRLSYALDLRGPSMTVQSACSGSLVSVHMARAALRNGDCRVAVVGGTALELLAERGYPYQPGGIGSADGRCRPFDAAAGGSARGEGAAVVVLKPLAAALAAGDEVIAVIAGSAVNNDGHDKAGFTAPSVTGHAAAVRSALRRAGLDPADLDYLEAHGTGTSLGDAVEVRALDLALDQRDQPCLIGSVKANLGHLDAAAGVVGLIKAAFIVSERRIPAQANFQAPTAALSASTRLDVTRSTVGIPHSGPVRVGVSSLGFGGTNAHVIVMSAPGTRAEAEPASGRPVLLPVSAMSPWSLRELCRRLAGYLQDHADVSLDDIAYTLQSRRRALTHRAWVVASDHRSAAEGLLARARRAPVSQTPSSPLEAAGQAWAAGADVEWADLFPERRRLVALPAYPFDRLVVARRPGKRLVRTVERSAAARPPVPGRLRWFITGGLGGVARALAEQILATRGDDIVVLAARSIPDTGVEAGGYRAVPLADRASTPSGDRLWTVRADVTEARALADARAACDRVLGPMDVVLHTAGVAAGQHLAAWSADTADKVLAAKVDGTPHLLETFPDAWLVLFSSLSTVKPVAGAADYGAANAFLDALAVQAEPDRPTVTTIAWPAWAHLGMARNSGIGISAADGLSLILGEFRRPGTVLFDLPDDPLTERHRAVQDTVPDAGPTESEPVGKLVPRLWLEVLGMVPEDPGTDLFAAGADSFSVLRFLDLLEAEVEVPVALEELLDDLTIAGHIAAVERHLAGATPEKHKEYEDD